MIDDNELMLFIVTNNGYRLFFYNSGSFIRCHEWVEFDSVMYYYINVFIQFNLARTSFSGLVSRLWVAPLGHRNFMQFE
jgi:hypothetical protein